MTYAPKETDPKDPAGPVRESLEPVVKGLGLTLLDLSVSRHRGSVQVWLTVYRTAVLGIDDCAAAHRAVMPRLELAFPGTDVYLEVSSPGIDRLIRDGSEFAYFIGRGVTCYRTDISDWTGGVLVSADKEGIMVKTKSGEISLAYGIIAKAKLSHSEEA